MRRRPYPIFLLIAATPTFAQASQSPRTPQPEDFGTVTGHVICSDTQHPARLAEVRLVPVAIHAPEKPGVFADREALGGGMTPVQTDLSGAFTMRHIKPGQYYLRVDYDGYATPLLGFTSAQLIKPSPEIQQRIATELQTVTVAPNASTVADTTIARGAAISGTVTYDDGSPAIGVNIRLLRRDAKGEFKSDYQPAGFTPPTDDHGHFREDALAPGEYVVVAELAMSETIMQTMPVAMDGKDVSVQIAMQKSLFNLPIYSGNVLRRRDAVQVQAAAGHEVSNVDLSVPISKLHQVSGSLLAKDGHTINGGEVKLLYADDHDEELTSVDIDREDKQFHFPYVPEDDYVLSVPAARDITRTEVESPKGVTPRTHPEDKTVRTYGAAEQPLKVETDVTGVIVNVPDKADKKDVAAAPAASTEP